MKLRAYHLNKNYNNSETGTTEEALKKKREYHTLQPVDSNLDTYLPPASGGGILFQGADVYLDGQDISAGCEVGSLQFVYQSLNRTFSTSAQRLRMGQEVAITTSEDIDDLRTKSDRLKRAQKPLQGNSWNDQTVLYLEFGFDGIPFLSAPRCLALSSLQQHYKNDNLMLPPGECFCRINCTGSLTLAPPPATGSCLEITLHKREPLLSALEWPAITANSYFSETPAAAGLMKTEELRFVIQSMGLTYESTVMSNSGKIANDLQSGSLQCFFDCPKISYQAMMPSQQRLNMSVLIPAGSKVAYIAFMHGHQLWESKADKKNLSGRTRFPTSLRRAIFTLPGHETIGFRRGFEGIGSSYGFSSDSCWGYYSDLRSQQVVDYDLEEVFPRAPATYSFLQAFLLDLRPYRIKKNLTMSVELEFSSNLSPEKMYLVSIAVRELSLFRAKGIWNSLFQE